MKNEKLIEVLKAGTQNIRAEYVARYVLLELSRLQIHRDRLAAVGMDGDKYAPYPNSNIGRAAYRMAVALHNDVSALFQSVHPCRNMSEPWIVVEKLDAEPRLRARAKQDAEALVDSYLYKMAGKIGKEIKRVDTNGCIWNCALLDVVCVDGERQSWKTSCILNRSVYGKLFNQWPTRRLE